MVSKLLMLLVLSLGASVAGADLIAKNGANSLLLRDNPGCSKTILEQVKPEYQGRFHPVEITIDGVKSVGCWAQVGDDIYLLAEDGSDLVLPLTAFQPYLGT